MTTAEFLRLQDVKVMDVYATWGLESAPAQASALASSAASTLVQCVVEEWIDFAMVFEQMQ